ncbi:UNVERIFIED_CONTAM: hypothetical protein NCL1_44425 [Trichonephila clavipes]
MNDVRKCSRFFDDNRCAPRARTVVRGQQVGEPRRMQIPFLQFPEAVITGMDDHDLFAHALRSLDGRKNSKHKHKHVPLWNYALLRGQVLISFFFISNIGFIFNRFNIINMCDS